MFAESRHRPSIVGDHDSAQKSRSIRWLGDEHGLNQVIRDFQVSFRLVHPSEIRF
jgi:hypothetical protein